MWQFGRRDANSLRASDMMSGIDMARRAKRLFTIGYEQTPSRAVLDELEAAGVKLLVDVRAVAPRGGRAFPRISSRPASTSAAFPICI